MSNTYPPASPFVQFYRFLQQFRPPRMTTEYLSFPARNDPTDYECRYEYTDEDCRCEMCTLNYNFKLFGD